MILISSNTHSNDITMKDPERAIRDAYRSTDKNILENAMQLGPGGSTAVTAIVIDGRDLWVANIGDSRAVLCERGSANQLTVDHEPLEERSRIEKQGGFVTKLPVPDIRHVPIDASIEFVILASDGLWKVMSNLEAIKMVKSIKDPLAVAKRLTSEALARKSKVIIHALSFGSYNSQITIAQSTILKQPIFAAWCHSTSHYLDNCEKRGRFTEQGDSITFESQHTTKITVMDHEKKRTLVMRKDGLPDAVRLDHVHKTSLYFVVVWNPLDKKAKAMVDFGDEEYKHMLCVEAAAVEKPITLKPGEEWRGRQELSTINKLPDP
ncbi:probable protein phosphatase 2C 44 [Tanacetum coccineum]